MLQEERFNKILEELAENGAVKNVDLSRNLGVSESTVRRDINELDEMGKRLGKQFVRCHKSYIVNMDYIHEFKGRKIYLKNGEEIAISKTCLETMKVGFAKYILGEGKINNCMYYFTQDKLGGEQ